MLSHPQCRTLCTTARNAGGGSDNARIFIVLVYTFYLIINSGFVNLRRFEVRVHEGPPMPIGTLGPSESLLRGRCCRRRKDAAVASAGVLEESWRIPPIPPSPGSVPTRCRKKEPTPNPEPPMVRSLPASTPCAHCSSAYGPSPGFYTPSRSPDKCR
jgi:hypothetical protein